MATIFLWRPRILRDVIAAQGDVLAWRGDRLTARRRENIIRGEHQHPRFQLRFNRQRHVHCHLVAVKVGIVSSTNEWMNPNGFTLDQLWFECLDRKAVQSRRTIQEHRMSSRYFVENIPYFGCLTLDHLLRTAHRVDVPKIFQSTNDERFEKNQCHLLRKTALVQL